jgi:hypothetical protein
MGIDATIVRPCSRRCIARCLRNIDGIAHLKINGIAQLTGSDRGSDLPSGARGRHRLRYQRRNEWLAHDNDSARGNALLMSV